MWENWFSIYNTEYIPLAMKIANKGPLMCPAYSFLLMEQMLTFFHKNSVSCELEGKK